MLVVDCGRPLAQVLGRAALRRHRSRRRPTPSPGPRRSSSGTCVPFEFSSPLYVGLVMTARPTGRPDPAPLGEQHRRVSLDEPGPHPRPRLEAGRRAAGGRTGADPLSSASSYRTVAPWYSRLAIVAGPAASASKVTSWGRTMTDSSPSVAAGRGPNVPDLGVRPSRPPPAGRAGSRPIRGTWPRTRPPGSRRAPPGDPIWRMCPARITAIRSPKPSASEWSWVTRTAVAPARRSTALVSSRSDSRNVRSRLENGSSRSTTAGSGASDRARATRCCWPLESSWG